MATTTAILNLVPGLRTSQTRIQEMLTRPHSPLRICLLWTLNYQITYLWPRNTRHTCPGTSLPFVNSVTVWSKQYISHLQICIEIHPLRGNTSKPFWNQRLSANYNVCVVVKSLNATKMRRHRSVIFCYGDAGRVQRIATEQILIQKIIANKTRQRRGWYFSLEKKSILTGRCRTIGNRTVNIMFFIRKVFTHLG
jgi:hypothetical protein